MSNVPTPNYNGLVEYLTSLGIDPWRVPEESVNADGYEYYEQGETKGPIVAWPNPEVYKNVVLLLGGVSLDKVIEPVNPAKKPTPKQKELADTLRTKAQNNLQGKPNPVVKKGAQ